MLTKEFFFLDQKSEYPEKKRMAKKEHKSVFMKQLKKIVLKCLEWIGY